MQNRKRDTDVQDSLLDSVGEGEGGMFQENWSFYVDKVHNRKMNQSGLDLV